MLREQPPISDLTDSDVAALRQSILDWYAANRRDLPWRAPPDATANPYHVWLSEVMLQQTTVATVRSRYARFLERWPTVFDLAAAALDEVLHEWQGLGYYARAHNLHRCARTVAIEHDGEFPSSIAALRALPGVGDYTAAAIAAIAFGLPAAPVDTNIERITARLFAVTEPLPASRPAIRNNARAIEPPMRPGDWAQALMDLGTAVCAPRAPRCLLCPAAAWCKSHQLGLAESLPTKMPRSARPLRRGVVYRLRRSDGALLLRRRVEKGMLGGMWEFPSAGWDRRDAAARDGAVEALAHEWAALNSPVRHGFTHFELELTVRLGQWNGQAPPAGSVWAAPTELVGYALPTLMKKVAAILPVPP
jgi:A/G-specific adenine glycosylase